MRVVSDMAARPASVGLAGVRALADGLAGDRDGAVLAVWRSQRSLLVTRQETRLPGFDEVCGRMADNGWPIVVRKSGGSVCPVGPGTLQFAVIEPALPASTMNAKYDALATLIQSTLALFGVASRTGAVTDAYCSGRYDLAVEGKKIAGMAQHWFSNRRRVRCVVTAASVNIEETPDTLARAVNGFHAGLGSDLCCQASVLTSLRMCATMDTSVRELMPAVISQVTAIASAMPDNAPQNRWVAGMPIVEHAG